MNLSEIKLTLENEHGFYKDYLACKNKQGSSVGPQRRKVLYDWTWNTCHTYLSMTEQLEFEMYFNNRYDLCPYGIQTTDAVYASKQEEKQEMNPTTIKGYADIDTDKPIVTKTFVYGKDFDTMTDDEVFSKIAEIEKEIAKLDAIKNKPKKLQAKIDKLTTDIAALTKLVDERE